MADLNSQDQNLEDKLNSLLTDITAVRTVLGGILTGSEAYDAGSIVDGDEEVGEITISGAALGDFVLVSHSLDVADLAITGAVTAADTVTYQLLNNTGGAVDLAAGTVYVVVIPRATFAAPAALTTTAGT